MAAWLSSNNLSVLPVRMKVGAESSRGGGFGFVHTLKHAAEMMESENVTPQEYFYRLSRHIAAMKNDDRHARKNPRGNVFGATGENTGKLVIELRPDDGCYTVISIHPHDIDAEAEKIRELPIGSALLRFRSSGETNPSKSSNQRTKTAADANGASGATRANTLPQNQQVVNIHDVNFLDESGEVVHFEPYNEALDFSVAGVKEAGIGDARKRGISFLSQVFNGAVNMAGMFLPKGARGWVQTSCCAWSVRRKRGCKKAPAPCGAGANFFAVAVHSVQGRVVSPLVPCMIIDDLIEYCLNR